MQHRESGKCSNIDVSVVAALATADTLAKPASGTRDDPHKAVRFRCNVRCPGLSLSLPEVQDDINQVLP